MGIELGVTVAKSLINSWYAAFVDLQDTNMPKAMAITTSNPENHTLQAIDTSVSKW